MSGFLAAIGIILIVGYCLIRWGSRNPTVVGPVVVATPRTNGIIATLQPIFAPHSPRVILCDVSGDGIIDNTVLIDAAGRYFEIIDTNGDGIWDKYTYETGTSLTNNVSYWDMDIDGTLDFMIGPKQSGKLRSSPEWRELHPTGISTLAFFTNINSSWHFPKNDQKEKISNQASEVTARKLAEPQ